MDKTPLEASLSLARWTRAKQRPLQAALALVVVTTMMLGLGLQLSPAIAADDLQPGNEEVEMVDDGMSSGGEDEAVGDDDEGEANEPEPDEDEEPADEPERPDAEEAEAEPAADETDENQDAIFEGADELEENQEPQFDENDQLEFGLMGLGGGGNDSPTDVTITMTADKSTARVGDTIEYTITVTNKGGRPATNVKVTDPLIALNENIGTLNGGDSRTFHGSYVVQESDLPGPKKTTAKVTGKGQVEECEWVIFLLWRECEWKTKEFTKTDSVTVSLLPNITLTKEANVSVAKPGDKITYTFTLNNDHSGQLRNVKYRDPRLGNPYKNLRNFGNGKVAAGATETETAVYTVQDADLPGPIDNEVEVVGEYCYSKCGTKNSKWRDFKLTARHTVDLEPNITVTKTPNPTEATVGDVITYTITVTNNQSFKLRDVKVSDPMLWQHPQSIGDVEKNKSRKIEGSYTVTAADLSNETLDNEATVTGKYCSENCWNSNKAKWHNFTLTASASVDLLTPVPTEVDLEVHKTVDKSEPLEGDDVTYTITVTNNGPAHATGVKVKDKLPGGVTYQSDNAGQGSYDPATGIWNVGNLAVDKTATLTITAKVNDGTAGRTITNTARVKHSNPADDNANNNSASAVITPQLRPAPAIKISKTADKDLATVGDEITYTIKIENTGNVTLTNVNITDEMLDLTEMIDTLDTGAKYIVDESKTKYTVQEDDLPGPLSNTANVTAQAAGGHEVSDRATTKVNLYAQPGLKVTKSANKERATVNDEVNFTITVKNTGNVTLNDIKVNDPMLKIKDYNIDTLAPGASVEVKGSYTVKETDLHKHFLINTAGAGVKYGNEYYSDEDTVKVKLWADRGIELIKEADVERGTVGTEVTYTFTVRNTGNIKLTDVTINDAMLGINQNIGNLDVGAQYSFDHKYTITEGDVVEGVLWGDGLLKNTATVTAKAGHKLVSDSDQVTIELYMDAAVDVRKTADRNSYRPGDVITYTITITNTGHVAWRLVSIEDTYDPAMLELISFQTAAGEEVEYNHDEETGSLFWDHFDLGAGESVQYTLQFRSLGTGSVTNEVRAVALLNEEFGRGAEDSVTVRVNRSPVSGGGSGGSGGGDGDGDGGQQDDTVTETDEGPLAGSGDATANEQDGETEPQQEQSANVVVEMIEEPEAGDLPRTGGSSLAYVLPGLLLLSGGWWLRRRLI